MLLTSKIPSRLITSSCSITIRLIELIFVVVLIRGRRWPPAWRRVLSLYLCAWRNYSVIRWGRRIPELKEQGNTAFISFLKFDFVTKENSLDYSVPVDDHWEPYHRLLTGQVRTKASATDCWMISLIQPPRERSRKTSRSMLRHVAYEYSTKQSVGWLYLMLMTRQVILRVVIAVEVHA